MNLQKIKILASRGESETLEFKKSTAQLFAAFETICAFLNGEGGVVLIGVTDDGKIIGQDVSDNTRQAIAHEIAKLEPATYIDIQYVRLKEGKTVICIIVERGVHAPYVYDGRAFQRNQSTKIRMSQHRYEQLLI